MHIIKTISFIILFSMTGCSSHKKPRPDAKVLTYITEAGVKNFQVVLAATNKPQRRKNNKRQAKSRSGRSEGKRPSMNSPAGNSSDQTKRSHQLHNRIERIISKHSFCREGFAEVDHYSEAGTIYFNGQCNEKGTDDDRLKYLNP